MQISGLGDVELGVISLYKLLEAKNIDENAPGVCVRKEEVQGKNLGGYHHIRGK